MDLTVHKVIKDQMKGSFQLWYASKITKQMESDTQICDLKPVDLRLSHVKPLSAQWIKDAHAYFKADRKLVFKGLKRIASLKHWAMSWNIKSDTVWVYELGK